MWLMESVVKNIHDVFTNVKVHANADSIRDPGKKSAVSQPIPKSMYKDFDDFFAEALDHSRVPVRFEHILFLKEFHYRMTGPDDSECKVTLDGKRLKLAGKQQDETDQVVLNYRTHVDFEGTTIVSEELSPSGEPKSWQYAVFHFDGAAETFCLESWVEMPDGERRSGDKWAGIVEWDYLKPHLAIRAIDRKVSVKALQPAPDDANLKIVMSSDVSAFWTTPEDVMDSFLAHLKQEALDAPGGTCEYIDAEDVRLTLRVGQLLILRTIRIDHAKNVMKVEESVKVQGEEEESQAQEFVSRHRFFKVYSEPLRLGYWSRLASCENAVGSWLDAVEISYRLNLLARDRDLNKQVGTLDDASLFF
mmetsp:Transcript_82271/g.183741  ORF Transcript_82271/g.183741 Transcript_82271/m.183741 type:complete len:362 (-) Transcript_82271:197-1282(-)